MKYSFTDYFCKSRGEKKILKRSLLPVNEHLKFSFQRRILQKEEGKTRPSNPTTSGVWLSLVERCLREADVAGSNPVTPI